MIEIINQHWAESERFVSAELLASASPPKHLILYLIQFSLEYLLIVS